MKLRFTKMQALGNDFILVDARRSSLKEIGQLAGKLCDRRFGIGADQLLILEGSRRADFKMRIFNADGSEVEMCGNGIRCLAKYIWDRKLGGSKPETSALSIETPAGIISLQRTNGLIKVDMGEPILAPDRIPVRISSGDGVLNYPLRIRGKTFRITCVSMGNPHAVIVVEDVHAIPLASYGPLIENHRIFPNRTNVEFIQIKNRRNIVMRVWERGAGETMACGTGASAASVASALLGLTGRKVTVHLPGGRLLIEWSRKDNHVYMAGAAEEVFEGTIALSS